MSHQNDARQLASNVGDGGFHSSIVCAHGAFQSQLHLVSCCCPMQPHLLHSNFDAIDMLQVKSPFHTNCRTSDVRA